jgi:hypothetical protein
MPDDEVSGQFLKLASHTVMRSLGDELVCVLYIPHCWEAPSWLDALHMTCPGHEQLMEKSIMPKVEHFLPSQKPVVTFSFLLCAIYSLFFFIRCCYELSSQAMIAQTHFPLS